MDKQTEKNMRESIARMVDTITGQNLWRVYRYVNCYYLEEPDPRKATAPAGDPLPAQEKRRVAP